MYTIITSIKNLNNHFLIDRFNVKTFKRHVYWPPPPNKRSPIIELPSGKKCFVFMGKRDADGKLEPVLCFIDQNGDKLTWFNNEEVHQFETLVPRLRNYFNLWESKLEEHLR